MRHFPFIILIIACMTVAVLCNKEEAKKEPGQPLEVAEKPLVISKLSAAPQQKPVSFNHGDHKKRAAASGKACKTCHHKGKISDKCSTPGCHFGPGAEKLVHKKCYGECHLAAAAAPKQTQCAGCHK